MIYAHAGTDNQVGGKLDCMLYVDTAVTGIELGSCLLYTVCLYSYLGHYN